MFNNWLSDVTKALVISPSDSTYTERFMGMPNLTDNYQGYDEGDLSKHVDQLKDKQFLLVSFYFCGWFVRSKVWSFIRIEMLKLAKVF